MSLTSNVRRGAVATESGIIVGGLAEYCLRRECGAVLSHDGCSNPECPDARRISLLQEGIIKAVKQGRRIFK